MQSKLRLLSEYCSQCSPFKKSYDIDLFKIALKLKKGYSTSFLCEGCENRAVYKDEKGLLYLAKVINDETELIEVKLEDLMA